MKRNVGLVAEGRQFQQKERKIHKPIRDSLTEPRPNDQSEISIKFKTTNSPPLTILQKAPLNQVELEITLKSTRATRYQKLAG
jgi:hypothetical protein